MTELSVQWLVVLLLVVATFLVLRRRPKRFSRGILLGFFHPYCDSCGGGERVLWVMVLSLLESWKDMLHIVIYSGDYYENDETTKRLILQKVKDRFKIDIISRFYDNISFVRIRSRPLLEAKWYPVGTMIFQSLASIIVGFDCFRHVTPDVYIDTTGAAFIYPLVKLLSLGTTKVCAYVHYPIISTDMLSKVREQRPGYNNNSRIASSVTISTLKLLYYKVFASFYSIVGSYADIVMVNSTWTYGHIDSLWNKSGKKRIHTVYPPCNTRHVMQSTTGTTSRKRVILSIGQFRPEKDHFMQLKAFQLYLDKLPLASRDGVELVLLGGTRNHEDEQLVDRLRRTAEEYGILSQVSFVVNAKYEEMLALLETSTVGLHTMWNEHFGISVVEMMAAGLIVIAHKSGGPKLDIITVGGRDTSGYLADSPEEYASHMNHILHEVSSSEQEGIRRNARASIDRFSDEVFKESVKKIFLDSGAVI